MNLKPDKCKDCIYFKYLYEIKDRYHDGYCDHPHNSKRKSVYIVYSFAPACFSGEWNYGQMDLSSFIKLL